MQNWNAFGWEKGRFYRGNLHNHTTRSDGAFTPEENTARFARAGYDFVAITDHRIYYRGAQEMNGLLVLPGMEADVNRSQPQQCHHLVCIGTSGQGFAHDERYNALPGEYTGPADVQPVIDNLKARDHFVILAHPFWSHTNYSDYGSFTGLDAMEVFNTGCLQEDDTGYSHMAWSEMLYKGHRIWAVATDDNHRDNDMGGGWVQVFAKELSQSAILNALRAGHFYASCGPDIHAMYVEDGRLIVECSSCLRVQVLDQRIGGHTTYELPGGEPVRRVVHPLQEGLKYVRVQCVDAAYKMAWSQPLFLD